MRFGVRKADLLSSFFVFLVALPLCVGIAVASGVPAELGVVTAVVGGLVGGVVPGSSVQVSGPAAGLTVFVYGAVQAYGVAVLGVLVFTAGLVQLGLGALRLGRWFRAVPVSVVQGMLAGIGIVLVAGQLYALGDVRVPATALGAVGGLGSLPGDVDPVASGVGGATIAVLLLWRCWGRAARLVPGPLVAVALASGATWVCDLDVRRVEVRGLVAAVRAPESADFGRLGEVGVVGTVVGLALLASAQSLFGAVAVERLPRGRKGQRVDFDRELMAQGVGNAVCGVLGALPLAAGGVGERSGGGSGGARGTVARGLYGGWLLAFVGVLFVVPEVLGVVPVAALAGLLVWAGCGLVPVREVGVLWREHRGEVCVFGVTAGAIVVAGLFQGVVVGLALSVGKTAWDVSRVRVEIGERGDGVVVVRVVGHATFLRLPKLLDELEALESLEAPGGLRNLPSGREVRLELDGLRHVDHACAAALEGWAAARGQVVGVVTGSAVSAVVATNRSTS
ncbi:SulP family inorganic anion transporter [Streptomyces sp. ME02-8801-2C]|uniref:SulP family inorganic anion transporter n=1 Tax=Streptomyces sp. ME02-8801-2C TaxID=3028680 RepID=UPI0029B469EC|nr:SulP family inorganic anion transporter [Streptomyces sp. ME02-8801-2C]MDX3456332.1 SulP family inorganic anion transporter [Streptomyces sp. ME02-8801-2C]